MEHQEFNSYHKHEGNDYVMQQNLPNATAVLVLGILSIIGCCCYGIIGLICSIVGLVLAKKDMKLYQENPIMYKGFSSLNSGRILCIIGLILSILSVLITLYIYAILGVENYQNMIIEWSQSMQQDIE